MALINIGGDDYVIDRLISADEIPIADLDTLVNFCRNKNLVVGSELQYELKGGTKLCFKFWDASKDFCYRLKDEEIIRVE